jgi:hypothetical protein
MPGAFGLQDKAEVLHQGTPGPGSTVVFELTLQARPHGSGAAVLSGDFAHGPPAGRFLYLGWRNAQGAFAQRLKLPLSGIAWADAAAAIASQRLLAGTLVDHHPKATRTGVNIGGTRSVTWAPP